MREGESIVLAHHGLHVDGDDLTILNDHAAVDHGVLGLLRSAEHGCRDRIDQATGVIDGVEVDAEEVRAHSWRQVTDVGTAEYLGSAARTDLEGLACRHPLGRAQRIRGGQHGLRTFRREQAHAQTGKQHRETNFAQHVVAVVAC